MTLMCTKEAKGNAQSLDKLHEVVLKLVPMLPTNVNHKIDPDNLFYRHQLPCQDINGTWDALYRNSTTEPPANLKIRRLLRKAGKMPCVNIAT